MGFSFNKGLTDNEKEKLMVNINLLFEIDKTPIDVDKNGRTRKIIVVCPECKNNRYIRLVDFLTTKGNLCNSCARKGNRNVSKRKDVRKKLSRKGIKDTSYATPEWRKKFSESRKGKKNPHYGDKESIESRRKKRLAALKNIEKRLENGGQVTPSYNPNACKFIDEYGKKNGYDFRHAENGGEYHIKELGYWVDGYDIDKNVVIEIDENHHFDSNGRLSDNDVKRQNEIEEFLNCEFIRLKI